MPILKVNALSLLGRPTEIAHTGTEKVSVCYTEINISGRPTVFSSVGRLCLFRTTKFVQMWWCVISIRVCHVQCPVLTCISSAVSKQQSSTSSDFRQSINGIRANTSEVFTAHRCLYCTVPTTADIAGPFGLVSWNVKGLQFFWPCPRTPGKISADRRGSADHWLKTSGLGA